MGRYPSEYPIIDDSIERTLTISVQNMMTGMALAEALRQLADTLHENHQHLAEIKVVFTVRDDAN